MTGQGLSAATVEILDDHTVRKMGGGAVLEQAAYLLRHKSIPSLVTAIEIDRIERAYTMERLEHVLPGTVRPADVVSLLGPIWAAPGSNPGLNRIALTDRLEMNLDHVKESGKLARALVERLPTLPVQRGLTHGDPTAENVMARPSGELVLIDPLPSQPRVPDFIEVDIGKMMQSATRWHHIVFGEIPPQEWHFDEISAAVPAQLFDAGMLWLPIHIVRTIQYVHPSKREEVLSLAYETAALV